ncbi:MAG: hypothetical protein C4529_03140 [Deltaproteobacteria bacterium]|nr:MAG: hypothetical protein C4529_03140 [Deltaproteobacteria bacterium]
MARHRRIIKGVVTFFLYLSIYTYMCIGGVGMALQVASPMAVTTMPMWHSAAYGAVSVACINGVYFLGGKLDRILAAEERTRDARAELLAAWRR